MITMQGRLIFIILIIIETGLCLHSKEKKANNKSYEQKGNPVQFGAMILCKVGRNPLDYNGYGCWCGLGGKGETVDEIDQCCYEHDQCYDKLIEKKICEPSIAVFTTTYFVSGCTKCASWQTRCMKKLCECDATAAKCFKAHEPKFKNKYKNHNQSKC